MGFGASHTPALVPLLDMADHRQGATSDFVLGRAGEDVGGPPVWAAPANLARGGYAEDPFECLGRVGGGPPYPAPALAPPYTLLGLRCGVPVPAGGPLTISYGALTNAALVLRYGFALPANGADTLPVHVGSGGLVVAGTGGVVGTRYALSMHGLPAGLLQDAHEAAGGGAGSECGGELSDDVALQIMDDEVAEFVGRHGGQALPTFHWLSAQLRRLIGELDRMPPPSDTSPRAAEEAAALAMCAVFRAGLRDIAAASARIVEDAAALLTSL